MEASGLLPWAGVAEVAAALNLAPGQLLVDLGCGRGGYSLEIARQTGARLLGLDFSAVAVAIARGSADTAGRAEFCVDPAGPDRIVAIQHLPHRVIVGWTRHRITCRRSPPTGPEMSYLPVNVKFMFDTLQEGRCPDGTMFNPDDTGPASVPLERLEAQICELAGHLAAATCRFLVLLGDFDARQGWASWEMTSCAAWLSWKCQMSSGTAREHVRVARALRDLPVIRGEFGAGRLSYAKVRALTRIATPDTEADLAELAGPMTGNQLERFARAHRQVSTVDDDAARIRRRLAWRIEDDGSLAGTFHLPPLAGAVLLKALRAAAGDLEHPHRSDAEHGPAAEVPGVSAETPAAVPGDPADPARCHVEDGPAISVSSAQLIGCSSSWTWMLHDSAGKLLDLGRRRRRPNAALRRAARERDKCRCRFPGCESRRVDLHHIRYWSNGGQTKLDNLVSLCKYHHLLVHDRGYLIAAARDGTLTFYRPDGTMIPASPSLPQADGTIEDWHDADITPETIIPPWYGERLDLDYAIYTCFANAANQASGPTPPQVDQPGETDPPAPLPSPTNRVIEPQDWMPSLRGVYTLG